MQPLTKDQITSTNLKKRLAYHLYWRLHYPIIIDEFQFMDVLGVRNNNYCVEFEVKVSKGDLDRELRIIKGGTTPIKWTKDYSKWSKHQTYLKKGNYVEFIPNDFYFYVPDFLSAYAAKECEGTPYGVAKIGNHVLPASGNTIYSVYEVVKKPEKLHTNKLNPK